MKIEMLEKQLVNVGKLLMKIVSLCWEWRERREKRAEQQQPSMK